MTIFDETQHPRAAAGTFTDKEQSAPELTLAALPPVAGGYDEIVETDRTIEYLRNGVGHREDGFAIEYRTGGGYYLLDGNYIRVPEINDGPTLALRYVADGKQFWSAEQDGRSYEAHVTDDTTEFFRDGLRHALGDPAVVREDGTEEWWVDGVHHPDALPRYATGSSNGRYDTIVGSKRADAYPDVAAVAKQVREDLKLASAAGVIPEGVTVSVRTSKYTGGQSINITVQGLTDADIYEAEGATGQRYTAKASKLINRLESIGAAYGRSTTDAQTDYFDYDYYTFAKLEDDWGRKFREDDVELRRQKRARASA